MATKTTRLGRTIRTFDTDIKTTSDYILAHGSGTPGITNGERLGWTPDEILAWTDFRTRWDVNMALYGNKKGTRTTNVRDILMGIIKEAVAYEKKHNLYDRIAVCLVATNDDFEAFNIIRFTPLAATTHTRTAAPGIKGVAIVLKKIGHLYHQLLVTTPDSESRAKQKGVKEIIISKAIGLPTAVAPALNLFVYAGSVSRGLVKVTHTDGTQGQKAWYSGQVKNSRGELGEPSEPIGFIII